MNANNIQFPFLKSSSFQMPNVIPNNSQQSALNLLLQQYERSPLPGTQLANINNSSGSKNNLLQISSAANLLPVPNQQSYNAAKNCYHGSNGSFDKMDMLSNGYVGQEFLRQRGSAIMLDQKQSQFYEEKNDMNLNNLESDASEESEDIRQEIKKVMQF